ARADRAPEPRRAEGERRYEPRAELVERALLDERLQLRARFRIGVASEPCFGSGAELGVGHRALPPLAARRSATAASATVTSEKVRCSPPIVCVSSWPLPAITITS